ncbi:endonuclease/exonuclease/phosphatase family protein [Amycolatopsis sp. lyj-112]|uniref:endonuclease/exonuclease/phosphatase family protein n=1 Tax=Amycolatopsis sp. lyj-112 TaxID=2789288 RepID=UPI00397AFC90
MRFGTYNLATLFGSDSASERERQDMICEIIRGLDVDVLAVQEVHAPLPGLAAARLDELGRRVGMTAYLGDWDSAPRVEIGKIAVGISPHNLHVGLLWNPDTVACVPGTFRSYTNENMHHGLIKAVFRVHGSDGMVYEVQHGSTHLTPFGPNGGRADEAVRVVSAFTRPLHRPPGLVGGDWNTVGADRDVDGNYYDPDPYAGAPWAPEFIYQCRRERDDHGRVRRWWADRTTGEVLLDGGLIDARVALHNATLTSGGVAWRPSSGHRSDDTRFGRRRIDGIRCTAEVVPALRAVDIVGGDLATRASDHLPEVVEYDPAAICSEAADGCP